MFVAHSIDAWISFAGGLLATYYGRRPLPAGPKQAEWTAWSDRWGKTCRIAGAFLIVSSLTQVLAKAL
jgi:hypothetical protein